MPIDPNWDPYAPENLDLPEDEYLAHFTEEEQAEMLAWEKEKENKPYNPREDVGYWVDHYKKMG